MHSCQNNHEIFCTENKTKHTPSGCSLFTHCSFDLTKNKLDCYKGEDCMERFCKDLREHAMKIIDYEKKKDTTNWWRKRSYEKQNVCCICKKEFNTDDDDNYDDDDDAKKSIIKSEILVITMENLEELLIIFVI